MTSHEKKILAEVSRLRALGEASVQCAISLEKMLTGSGKPVSTRKGFIEREALLLVNKRAMKKQAQK